MYTENISNTINYLQKIKKQFQFEKYYKYFNRFITK